MWAFTPPTVAEAPAMWGQRMMLRIKLPRGISLLEGPPGTWRAARFPTQDEIREATRFMQGGYWYEVDDSTKAALIGAGLATEPDFVTPLWGYGGGGYGDGLYGG